MWIFGALTLQFFTTPFLLHIYGVWGPFFFHHVFHRFFTGFSRRFSQRFSPGFSQRFSQRFSPGFSPRHFHQFFTRFFTASSPPPPFPPCHPWPPFWVSGAFWSLGDGIGRHLEISSSGKFEKSTIFNSAGQLRNIANF